MDRWKSRGGKSQRREEQKREGHRGERVRRKKMQVCEKVAKSRNEPKVAGAEPCGQMRDKKLHAVVARSTFRSQNAQNTPFREHFWKLRCRKSARRCGAKHIWKSKCTKHTILGALLEVEMSKKCTPLWREAHSKSKCTKHTRVGALLEVEMSKKCTPLWREAHFQVRMHKAPHFWITFGRSDVVSRGRRKGLGTLSKVRKM